MAKLIFKLTEEERNELGKNMRIARGSMTQVMMCDRMGFSNKKGKGKMISLFETGKKEPSKAILLSFAKVLNLQVHQIISKEIFDKLDVETTHGKPRAFNLEEAKSESENASSEFEILINERLLKEVSDKNPFGIEMSIIISAGLNHFLNLSTYDALRYLILNIKDKDFEKALMLKIMEQEKYKEGLESLRALVERK